MRKVFISYHHANDQEFKDYLVAFGKLHGIFIDKSVAIDDIGENLKPETIRTKIRDEYLRDSTVTILLVGSETKNRKHVDWELYSSMYNGTINKQSGILVINLPYLNNTSRISVHGKEEQDLVYPNITGWSSITQTFEAQKRRFPDMPPRIIDNIIRSDAPIAVTYWGDINQNPQRLSYLIEKAAQRRNSCNYDLRRDMRMKNS